MKPQKTNIHQFNGYQFSLKYTEHTKKGYIKIDNNDDGNFPAKTVEVFKGIEVDISRDEKVLGVRISDVGLLDKTANG